MRERLGVSGPRVFVYAMAGGSVESRAMRAWSSCVCVRVWAVRSMGDAPCLSVPDLAGKGRLGSLRDREKN